MTSELAVRLRREVRPFFALPSAAKAELACPTCVRRPRCSPTPAPGLAEDLLRVAALALDLPDDFFVTRCRGSAWRAALTWHPARDQVVPVLPGQYGRSPHTGVDTLIVLGRQPGSGLQVCSGDGQRVDVPFVPGALTVNAGDLLARWTGDRWRPAPHRVLPPPVGEPGMELLSLCFSAEADPLTVVEAADGRGPAGAVRARHRQAVPAEPERRGHRPLTASGALRRCRHRTGTRATPRRPSGRWTPTR